MPLRIHQWHRELQFCSRENQLATNKNKWYVLVAYYYSKFPYMLQMYSVTFKDVISALSFCFSVLGTPEEIICDNATNCNRREYKELAINWGFTPTTSSPHYPKGRGFIERQGQTIKKLFARCDEDSTNYNLALQDPWTTPINSNLQSPAELFFNRQLKTTLLAIIRPPHNSEAVRASLKARHDYSRYDVHSKEKPDLPTQPIWVQDTIS